jgi:hypothetical protein
MLISNAVAAIKGNYSKNIVRVFGNNSSTSEMISEIWPKDANSQFYGRYGFWVCVSDSTDYCAENDPPLMPWQDKRPTLTDPVLDEYTGGGSPPDSMGQGNGQNSQTQGEGMASSQSGGSGQGSGGTPPTSGSGNSKVLLFGDFYVTYTDAEGDLNMVSLYIDGRQYVQSIATGSSAKSGLRYKFNVELSGIGAGTHQYWFEFGDGKNSDIRYPKSKNLTFYVAQEYARANDQIPDGKQQSSNSGSTGGTTGEGQAGPRDSEPASTPTTTGSAVTGFAFAGFRFTTPNVAVTPTPAVQNYAYEQPNQAKPAAVQALDIVTPGMQRFANLVTQIKQKQAPQAAAPSVQATPETPKVEAVQAKAQTQLTTSGIWTVRRK